MSPPFPSKIYLTGFMGSGKSTLGRALADLMHRDFVDSDEEITKQAGKSIQEIFASEGETKFRKFETEVLQKISQAEGQFVIALGGGATCRKENLRLVLSTGFVVYLQLPIPVLVSRLEAEKEKRPLLSNLEAGELQGYIEKKLKEREPFYEQAHLMVNGIHLDAPLLYEIIRAAAPQDHN